MSKPDEEAVETADLGFDPLKKKKKKKVRIADDAADVPAAEEGVAKLSVNDEPAEAKESEEAEEATLDTDLTKKKKKKKKPVLEEAEQPAEEAAPAEDADESIDLAKKKKKKKKVVVVEEGEEAEAAPAAEEHQPAEGEEQEGEEEDDENEDIVFEDEMTEKKKKPKKVKTKTVLGEAGDEVMPWIGSDRDYTYAELLGRIVSTLQKNNPELSGEKKRFVMKPPQVVRDGSKKSVFLNFAEISRIMNRNPEHVFQFILAELGTTGSIDGSQRMVIRGRFPPKAIENIIRKYAVEYVTCHSCKSPDTALQKEDRLFFLLCNRCGAKRSVSAIKAGYMAQVGKRKKV